ncbi:pectinesterase 1-like [Rutidosis leptorrhynchoides]|uniref:pectinesterase 1-like n=1 Tax=Rutidosis leptorrhynchoides TaxID=125765 RepID=UPI003A9A5CA6
MEESVNFVNGYGKIDPTDDEITPVPFESPAPKRRRTVAVIVTLLLFAVIIGSILTAGVVNTPNSKPSDSNSKSIKSSKSIKAVCAVTQHPDSCFTDVSTIDSGNFIDPEMIFNLTLQLAVTELVNISSLPKTLISQSTDLRSGSALRDCVSLFDDAVSQLSQSIDAMSGGEKKKPLLTKEKLADLNTWISAAMTDQETCVDGLEEMRSTAVDEVKMKIKKSSDYMSNSLAILDNLEKILAEFGRHLH